MNTTEGLPVAPAMGVPLLLHWYLMSDPSVVMEGVAVNSIVTPHGEDLDDHKYHPLPS
jgi:hypothetical protein